MSYLYMKFTKKHSPSTSLFLFDLAYFEVHIYIMSQCACACVLIGKLLYVAIELKHV